MARIAIVILLALVSGAAFGGVSPEAMKDWRIVVASDAIPSEKYAAQEFRALFGQATVIVLQISSDPSSVGNVFIGRREDTSAPGVGDLGEEGLRIITTPNTIAITGGRPRGTLYGVYEFFEKYFGVRFLTADDTYVPKDVKSIPFANYSYKPPFSLRFCWSYGINNHPAFAARMRNNAITDDEKLGGRTQQTVINHSIWKWITPALYGKTHPEYFSLVNGKRQADVRLQDTQLCVTNPDVLDIVTKGVLEEIAAHPEQKNFSVSQNDNDNYCHCENCERINKREGSPMGAHLAFVNAVAERVEKIYPNVKIGSLAYQYTRRPPRTIVPRKNVQIQLCSIECCTFHAIDDPACPKNQEFCSDMRAWKKICNDVWVWNYDVDHSWYEMPIPNVRSISRNIRFFQKNNAKGLFMQCDSSPGAEMCDMKNYAISRCLWNPSLDSWAEAMEFCRLYYGKAAGTIIEYENLVHSNVQKRGLHPGTFPPADEVGVDPKVASKIMALFQKAHSLAENDIIRARVEEASVCAYMATLETTGRFWKVENGKCHLDLVPGYQELLDHYIDLHKKYELTRPVMFVKAQEWYDYLQSKTKTYKADTIENQTWRLSVLPEMDGAVVEMIYKPTGRNLLASTTHTDIQSGKLDEPLIQGGDKGGVFDCKVEGSSIRLSRKLENGTVLNRHISLIGNRISFETNLSGGSVVQMKVHPELNVASSSADRNEISAYAKDKRWQNLNKNWQKDEKATGLTRTRMLDLPSSANTANSTVSELAFFNRKLGFGAAVSFQSHAKATRQLWWNPDWSQMNLEFVTKPAKDISYRYDISYLYEPPVAVSP